MSQRRIRNRQTELPTLPYWRSILASFLLVLSMLFFFEVLADPRSGELRSPKVVTPVFALFVIVDAGVFYAEFRLRKSRPQAAVHPKEKIAMKGGGSLC
jgi:protein-S-isoprenylcysteine O-methyltransferase Ste14